MSNSNNRRKVKKLSPTNSMTTSTTNSTNGTRKTPENSLGENKNLVNLDNLLGSNAPSTAGGNPFLTSSAPAVNPFAAQQRESPILNEKSDDARLFDANEHTVWIDSDGDEETENIIWKQNFFLPYSDHNYDTPDPEERVIYPQEGPFPIIGAISDDRDPDSDWFNIPVKTTPVTEEVVQEEEVTVGTILEVVIALNSFKASSSMELSFIKGEPLEIVLFPEYNPDWWQARNTHGKIGLVPQDLLEDPRLPGQHAKEKFNFFQYVSKMSVETEGPLELKSLVAEFIATTSSNTSFATIMNWLTRYRNDLGKKSKININQLAKEVYALLVSTSNTPLMNRIKECGKTKTIHDKNSHRLIGYSSFDCSFQFGVLKGWKNDKKNDKDEDGENGQDTMEHKPWFFGRISEGRAEELLHHGQEGEFLVRDSESNVSCELDLTIDKGLYFRKALGTS
ncbi:unnamed protein product [Caenorhabditis brenneri]